MNNNPPTHSTHSTCWAGLKRFGNGVFLSRTAAVTGYSMLSRNCVCKLSRSRYQLHRKLFRPCFDAPHVLPTRNVLSQTQAFCSGPSIFSVRYGRESREDQQRDGSLTYVRFFSNMRKENCGSELQTSLPCQTGGEGDQGSDGINVVAKLSHGYARRAKRLKEKGCVYFSYETGGEEDQVSDGGVKLSHRSARCAPAKTKKPKQEKGCVYFPYGIANDPAKAATSVALLITEKNKDSAAEASKRAEFKPSAEICSVVIKRKLTRKFLSQLRQKIDFLHAVSVPVTQVKLLLTKRAFLSASPEKLVTVVDVLSEFFESKSIALDLLVANAGILARPIENLKQRLRILAELEVDRETCIKFGTAKRIWTLQVQNFEKRLNFFKELGMDAQARNTILRGIPSVLNRSERSLRNLVEFLESIGFCGPKLLRFMKLNPRIFASSVNTSLVVKLKLFQSWGLSMKNFANATRHICRHSLKRIDLRYDFLREQGFPHEAVLKIFKHFPGVFSQSQKTIKVKLDYLVHELNRDICDVAKFPAYLAYSLEGRIAPRFRALEAAGLPKTCSLCGILSSKPSVFKRRYKIPDSVDCF